MSYTHNILTIYCTYGPDILDILYLGVNILFHRNGCKNKYHLATEVVSWISWFLVTRAKPNPFEGGFFSSATYQDYIFIMAKKDLVCQWITISFYFQDTQRWVNGMYIKYIKYIKLNICYNKRCLYVYIKWVFPNW